MVLYRRMDEQQPKQIADGQMEHKPDEKCHITVGDSRKQGHCLRIVRARERQHECVQAAGNLDGGTSCAPRFQPLTPCAFMRQEQQRQHGEVLQHVGNEP